MEELGQSMTGEREVFHCHVHGEFFFSDEGGCPSCQEEWEGPIEPDDPRIDEAMAFRDKSE